MAPESTNVRESLRPEGRPIDYQIVREAGNDGNGDDEEYHVGDVALRHETEEAAPVPAVHDREPLVDGNGVSVPEPFDYQVFCPPVKEEDERNSRR